MRRIATAALLAAPLLLAGPGLARANDGPCTFGLGCGGMCLRFFPHIHQHGPLFNYGPYYGYPPFEPYGYWNAYLQYTGPVPPPNASGGGPGAYGWIHGGYGWQWGNGNPHSLFHGGGVRGVFHHGHGGGCSSCASAGGAAESYVTAGNALDRYTGFGQPDGSAAYYAETPTLLVPAGVVPVAFPGR